MKIFKFFFQKSLNFFLIFLNVFLPILFNIGLYTYTVRYKSGIKIPGFSLKYFPKKIIFMHTTKS
jgi:hypothetical protein